MSTLEDQFKELQQLPQGTPLLQQNELASILKTTAHTSAGNPSSRIPLWKTIMSISAGLLFVGAVASLWLTNPGSTSSTQASAPLATVQEQRQQAEQTQNNNKKNEPRSTEQNKATQEQQAQKQQAQEQQAKDGTTPSSVSAGAALEEQRRKEALLARQTQRPIQHTPDAEEARQQELRLVQEQQRRGGTSNTATPNSNEALLQKEKQAAKNTSTVSGTFLERENVPPYNPQEDTEWGSDILAMKSLKSLSLTDEELERVGIRRSVGAKNREVLLIPGEEKIRPRTQQKKVWQSLGVDVSRPAFLTKIEWRIVQDGNEASGTPVFEYDTMRYSRTCPVYIINQMFQYNSAGKAVPAGMARFWNSNAPLLSSAQTTRSDSLINLLYNVEINRQLTSEQRKSLRRELDKESALCLKNLIPVHIMIGDSSVKTEGNKFSHITVFFVPTPELVQALPQRYAQDIQSELLALEQIDNGASARTACANLRGDSYFGVCKMYSANIDRISVFPSVTSSATTCRITATKAMNVRITAHYVNGALAREVTKRLALHTGDNDISIDLSGLENGMYVIHAESDEGDVVVARVIRQ